VNAEMLLAALAAAALTVYLLYTLLRPEKF
jgi:K+-transporting ATPase KdpF subunit